MSGSKTQLCTGIQLGVASGSRTQPFFSWALESGWGQPWIWIRTQATPKAWNKATPCSINGTGLGALPTPERGYPLLYLQKNYLVLGPGHRHLFKQVHLKEAPSMNSWGWWSSPIPSAHTRHLFNPGHAAGYGIDGDGESSCMGTIMTPILDIFAPVSAHGTFKKWVAIELRLPGACPLFKRSGTLSWALSLGGEEMRVLSFMPLFIYLLKFLGWPWPFGS